MEGVYGGAHGHGGMRKSRAILANLSHLIPHPTLYCGLCGVLLRVIIEYCRDLQTICESLLHLLVTAALLTTVEHCGVLRTITAHYYWLLETVLLLVYCAVCWLLEAADYAGLYCRLQNILHYHWTLYYRALVPVTGLCADYYRALLLVTPGCGLLQTLRITGYEGGAAELRNYGLLRTITGHWRLCRVLPAHYHWSPAEY